MSTIKPIIDNEFEPTVIGVIQIGLVERRLAWSHSHHIRLIYRDLRLSLLTMTSSTIL